MRLLNFSLALCTFPAAAQSIATAPRTTLDEHLPQYDSRMASGLPPLRTLGAKPLLRSFTTLEPVKVASVAMTRNSTCFAMRSYEFTAGRDSADFKAYSTCIPASSGHTEGAVSLK